MQPGHLILHLPYNPFRPTPAPAPADKPLDLGPYTRCWERIDVK